MMHDQEQKKTTEVRPQSIGQGCAYLIALAIFGTIEFIEAIPYHLSFYLWHFTGGQIKLRFTLWRLGLEQKRIRKGNSYYQKHIR